MTTVIDELVIKLGLDNTSFRQQVTQSQENVRKVSDEAQKQAKLIEAAGQRAASFFTKLRNEALALFALFVGTSSIKNFIQQTTLANAALGQTAKNIGISTKELSAWGMAAERAQGSAEGVTSSMRSLSQDFQTSMLTGQNTQSMNVLAQLGIMVQDPHHPGQMRPIDEIYKDVADRMKGMAPAQAQALGRMLGMDEGTVNLLMKGRAELDKLLEEMRRLGTVSDEDAKVGQDLINSFKGVSDAITDVGRAILREVSPFLTDMLNGMKEWIVQNKEWLKGEISQKVREFGEWLRSIDWKQIHKDVDDFLAKVNHVVDALGGWVRITEILLGLWIGNKFLGAIQNIARLTGVIAANPIIMALLALGSVAVGDTMKKMDIEEAAKAMGFEKRGGSLWNPFDKIPHWVNPQTGEDITNEELRKRLGVDPYSGEIKGQQQSFTADMSMSPAKKAGLDALAGGESKSYYDQNPTSSAYGRYQFINSTEAEISAATGIHGRDPESQDKKGWYLMARTYSHNTGRDLETDLREGGHDEEIAYALNKVWPSLPGGSQQNTTMAMWKARLAEARNRYNKPGASLAPDPSLLKGSQAATVNNSRTSTTTTNNDSNTHINGPITVQTAATDADGVAKGLSGALRKYLPVQEANYGLA